MQNSYNALGVLSRSAVLNETSDFVFQHFSEFLFRKFVVIKIENLVVIKIENLVVMCHTTTKGVCGQRIDDHKICKCFYFLSVMRNGLCLALPLIYCGSCLVRVLLV